MRLCCTPYHGEHTQAIVIDLHFESGPIAIPSLQNFMDRAQKMCAKMCDNCIYLLLPFSALGILADGILPALVAEVIPRLTICRPNG